MFLDFFVGCLSKCVAWTDLGRQLYVLLHGQNLQSRFAVHPVKVYNIQPSVSSTGPIRPDRIANRRGIFELLI